MSEPQTIPANTWTRIAGTDLEVNAKMDGVSSLEVEHIEAEDGGTYVMITGFHNSGGPVSLRAPERPVKRAGPA
jgi:hypothetical protein